MSEKIEISVVIPVYNEEENLVRLNTELLAVLNGLSRTFEIIYVNDGSKDNSQAILDGLSADCANIKPLSFVKNCGQTAAFAAGFASARGEYVVTLDADLQNSPSDIPKLIAYFPQYDVVCGVRKKRKDTVVKIISSRVANAIRNYLTNDTITDTGCSLKAFKKSYLDQIPLFEGMHRFFPTLIKLKGGKVLEVEVNHFPRVHGISKYNVFNRVFVSFIDCLAVRWMQQRDIKYKIR